MFNDGKCDNCNDWEEKYRVLEAQYFNKIARMNKIKKELVDLNKLLTIVNAGPGLDDDEDQLR